MSDKLQEALIKYLNREAVATQSPGLPGFCGYPGKIEAGIQPHRGCALHDIARRILIELIVATSSR